MNDRRPPLTALRAFEAASRHMSFSIAAAELNVTPAALSFQIKSLEEQLGAQVFRRLNRKVELTAEGATLAPGLTEAFAALQAAWNAARLKLDQGHLTVTTGPGFMTAWMAPRISKFVAAHPELELRLTASLKLLNFQRDGIDLAIRFGPIKPNEEHYSEILFEDWSTPMAVPELAAKIRKPTDILQHTLIGQGRIKALLPLERWESWSEAAGVATPAVQGTHFSAPDSAINYAANGGGVVLGRVSIAEPYLVSGRLVMPLKETIKRGVFCRLVCPLGFENTPNVAIFRSWIKEEIKSLEVFEKDREFI
ncbi:MAG: LysR substrate-binding domain-containing protein [Sneathiella sp.]